METSNRKCANIAALSCRFHLDKRPTAAPLIRCRLRNDIGLCRIDGITPLPNHPPVDTGMDKQEQQEDAKPPAEPLLALPPSVPPGQEEKEAPAPEVQTITVDGTIIKLDRLGPIIVNTDGTLTRIANWAALSEPERQTALRRIAKRNRERRQRLEEEQEGGGGQGQG